MRLSTLFLSALFFAPAAYADETPIRIGVMGDLSGYSAEIGGPGAVLAVKMAVEDHHGRVAGRPVEVLEADMQNRPDLAAQIARRWFDVDHVDMVTDLPNTPVALAVTRLGAEANRMVVVTEAAATDLTGAQCQPTTIHFADDTNALAAGTARALVAQGLKSWFFLTADFGFGIAMENSARQVVESSGGTVVGPVRHPLAASAFSWFLLPAPASNAQLVALANVGGDTINAIKQASEFGLTSSGQQIAGLLMVISDIKALGLEATKGLWVTESFYWDTNEKTRAFAKRFAARDNGKMPTKAHAANYAAASAWLDAVDAAGTTDPKAVKAKMVEKTIDFFGRPAQVRADGRVTYDLDLYRVKAPSESKAPYDFYTHVRTIPSAEAWLPVGAGGCKLGG